MASSSKYKRLMEPGYLGSVRTKNRLLKMGSTLGFYPWEDGQIQLEIIDSYETFAKGGVGCVTVGAGPLGVPPGMGYAMNDDKYLPRMSMLAEAIHKYDCPAFVQTFHLGPMLPPFLWSKGGRALSASTMDKEQLPLPHLGAARELTVPEIEQIVEQFVDIAERIKKAGFDGIELNAGSHHLLNSFISRAWNKRQDEYGVGSFESRAKIMVDIIKEVKRLNGEDFVIVSLFNVAEPGLKNGMTPEEGQEIAKILEDAGTDAIHARAEFYNTPKVFSRRNATQLPDIAFYPETPFPLGGVVDDSRHGKGGWVPLAAAVKKSVSIPVITIGRLDPDLGESVLRSGKADFISFNRRLMADPELPNKLIEGRMDDIRPCTGCTTCFDNNEHGNPPLCQVNAAIGRDKEYEIKPAQKVKKVVVVGGGPGGMEAARIAALRNHKVTLFEKERSLGGSMRVSSLVKGFDREDILGFIHYLKTQIAKLGVEIRLGTEVNKSLIAGIKPDVLVIAAGAAHNIPEIPGMDKRNVMTSKILHQQLKRYLRFIPPRLLRPLTKIWMPIGKKVVIMGGGIQGCQTAEFLVERGRKVTIVETDEEIGEGLLDVYVKPQLIDWLDVKGVAMFSGVSYQEVTDKGLVITTKEGKKEVLEADTVVTALSMLPNNTLIKELEGLAPEVYAIGDCKDPQLVVNAVGEGSRIARVI